MSSESRVTKVLLNARVNFIYYLAFLLLSFFTRKVFLEKLGTDFVGLSSTVGNLLGMLNLAELGIGGSIAMTMYKPLYDGNKEELNNIVSVLGFLYSRVGMVVAAGGLVMALFVPLLFANTIFEYAVIYAMFFSMLTGSLMGYFINYRQFLLNADQKGYEITRYSQAMCMAKVLIQVAVAYFSSNYYYWIGIEFAFGVLYAFVLNWRIRAVYPWLKANVAHGGRIYKQYPQIMLKAKQVFVHNLAGMVRGRLLPFLMYSFTSLYMVALYANYTLVTDKINGLIGNFLNSTGAGIGNLVAEGNTGKILHVFWELFAIKFFIAVFVSYAVFVLINPFISIWLGGAYLLGRSTIMLLLLINFIGTVLDSIYQFRSAYGLVWDVWAPVVTLLVMLPLAVVGGHLWGLPGVLMGNVVSSVAVLAIWHPYMLFHYGFKRSVWEYWRNYLRYLAVGAVSVLLAYLLNRFLPYADCTNFATWCVYALEVCTLLALILLPLMYAFCPGAKHAMRRIERLVRTRSVK